MSDTPQKRWIVYVPQESFTVVYGTFQNYDAAMDWVRANGHDADTASVHPIKEVRPPVSPQEDRRG